MTALERGFEAHASTLQTLLALSPDHFYLYDRAGRHRYVSPAVAQALGIEQEVFIGKTWEELGFPTEDTRGFDLERERVFEHGRHWHGELLLPTELGRDSASHDYILSPVLAGDGTVEAVLVAARDISERKEAEATLQYQALHDALTGLANRTLLNDRLEQSLGAARRSKTSLALLFLDLDHFKEINDTYGHQVGDILLQQLAGRWSAVLRASDTLSRLGGDEFMVLLPDTDGRGADAIAERLYSAIGQKFEFEGHALYVSASIGIALDVGGKFDANALMKQADGAMYRAKRARRD